MIDNYLYKKINQIYEKEKWFFIKKYKIYKFKRKKIYYYILYLKIFFFEYIRQKKKKKKKCNKIKWWLTILRFCSIGHKVMENMFL
jgi:hypothetical protein